MDMAKISHSSTIYDSVDEFVGVYKSLLDSSSEGTPHKLEKL